MSDYLQYTQFSVEKNETWRGFVIVKGHIVWEGSMTSLLICLMSHCCATQLSKREHSLKQLQLLVVYA